MNDDKRYTVVIDTAYRSTSYVWYILEIDMDKAVHIGFGMYKVEVAAHAGQRRLLPCVVPMTRDELFAFICPRLVEGDWADVLYLNGTRLRDIHRVIRKKEPVP